MRKYDIIVYGASGFTAGYVIEELLAHNSNFALAGRNKANILKNIQDIPKAQNLEIMEYDPDNAEKFTSQARIVINMAGPYIFSGEKIIQACLNTQTHYLDITGETFFIENVIKNYSKSASEKNVCIVNCCGFDSVPADLGVEYLKNVLQSNCKIQSVMKLNNSILNYTTYQSLICGIKNVNQTRKLRNKKEGKKLKKYFYNPQTNSYNVIFMGTDPSVVKRTQCANKKNNKSVADYYAYFDVGSWLNLQLFKFFFMILLLFSKFEFTCNLLLKYPSFFTFGKIKKDRPCKQALKNASFELKFWGESEREKKILTIYGPDPGYKTTAICIVSCANSLLQSENVKGGVLTPGECFYEKGLCEILKSNGLKFLIE
ncbi:Saccharopine dehydrogenase [Tubulinosema ratisbonensis]|uniref:Saccharopine dehydrogenase n=1 Tax=Tubulinosema ratisbonensis TaxID=291195 RepID=A0A437AKW6_9MICR|nr:Saccharopine dehydrogenase [Tubulinosema ratisbonensis]